MAASQCPGNKLANQETLTLGLVPASMFALAGMISSCCLQQNLLLARPARRVATLPCQCCGCVVHVAIADPVQQSHPAAEPGRVLPCSGLHSACGKACRLGWGAPSRRQPELSTLWVPPHLCFNPPAVCHAARVRWRWERHPWVGGTGLTDGEGQGQEQPKRG